MAPATRFCCPYSYYPEPDPEPEPEPEPEPGPSPSPNPNKPQPQPLQVVLPKGWSGHWDIIETVKKVWVVLSD